MIAFNASINSDEAESSLNLLQAQLSDLSPAMELIAEDIREMEAEQFASSGAGGGTPWAALAPSTVKRKHGAGGILVASGALRDSLTEPDSPDHVEAIDNLSLEIGTSLPYAMFQQAGAGWGFGEAVPPPAPRRSHGVPMRPLLVMTADRQDRWVGFVARQLESQSPLLSGAELGKQF